MYTLHVGHINDYSSTSRFLKESYYYFRNLSQISIQIQCRRRRVSVDSLNVLIENINFIFSEYLLGEHTFKSELKTYISNTFIVLFKIQSENVLMRGMSKLVTAGYNGVRK